MEARLSQQILRIIELDKSGHLTPEIQDQISDVLDHLHAQHMAAGGSLGPIGPNAGLGPFINAAGAVGKVKVPRTQFPKLPKPPALPGGVKV